VTKTQSAGPISCLEHRATRVLHCDIVTRAAVLMFPLLLQTVISNQMRPWRLRGGFATVQYTTVYTLTCKPSSLHARITHDAYSNISSRCSGPDMQTACYNSHSRVCSSAAKFKDSYVAAYHAFSVFWSTRRLFS